MINDQLINPQSIVVIGGSNNIHKPGGKILQNLIEHGFKDNKTRAFIILSAGFSEENE
jgi:acyl-CoA synthetase (NDP forming)